MNIAAAWAVCVCAAAASLLPPQAAARAVASAPALPAADGALSLAGAPAWAASRRADPIPASSEASPGPSAGPATGPAGDLWGGGASLAPNALRVWATVLVLGATGAWLTLRARPAAPTRPAWRTSGAGPLRVVAQRPLGGPHRLALVEVDGAGGTQRLVVATSPQGAQLLSALPAAGPPPPPAPVPAGAPAHDLAHPPATRPPLEVAL